MEISKGRIEAFSDGVIAIIITIMVLEIPPPAVYTWQGILGFLHSIFVYFVSFMIVALQWNKHRHLFDMTQIIGQSIIWRNIIYLFLLSLMPIFTKWVIENPSEMLPVLSYDILYLLVNISYQFLFNAAVKSENFAKGHLDEFVGEKRFFFMRFVVFFIGIASIFGISFANPKLSIIFFIGLPVGVSLLNLFHDNERSGVHGRQKKKA